MTLIRTFAMSPWKVYCHAFIEAVIRNNSQNVQWPLDNLTPSLEAGERVHYNGVGSTKSLFMNTFGDRM